MQHLEVLGQLEPRIPRVRFDFQGHGGDEERELDGVPLGAEPAFWPGVTGAPLLCWLCPALPCRGPRRARASLLRWADARKGAPMPGIDLARLPSRSRPTPRPRLQPGFSFWRTECPRRRNRKPGRFRRLARLLGARAGPDNLL
jgi:hypothetical protein